MQKFFRSGNIENSSVDLIFEQLKSSIGNAFIYENDDLTSFGVEIYAYAFELDAIKEFGEMLKNRNNPLKCNPEFLNDLINLYQFSDLKSISQSEIRNLLSIYLSNFKRKFTHQILFDSLIQIAPSTFDYIFYPKTTQIDIYYNTDNSFKTYNPNISSNAHYFDYRNGINYNSEQIRPLHPAIESETIVIDGSTTSGITYYYLDTNDQINDYWYDVRNTIVIMVKNEDAFEFSSDLKKMDLYLKKIMPTHIRYAFAVDLGFTLDTDLLDSLTALN